jgi:hypothetical protein
MIKPKSSFILSPNLGCPEIASDQAINERGFRVVIAVSEEFDTATYALKASPSFAGQGQDFTLELAGAQKLHTEGLPSRFEDVSETRLLISTTLRTELFPGYSFWAMWVKPKIVIGEQHLRTVNGHLRSTLYDLALAVGGVVVGRVRHALCLRVGDPCVKFIHLTDLHLAARNDLWEAEVHAVIEGSPVTPGPQAFKNFNGRLREFIRWANEAADKGELDFIWALGDLVDFCRTGLFDHTPGDSNWSIFTEIVAGSPAEQQRGNEGLRVPIFTTTGNHDWRTYPYSPVFRLDIFGITKKCAEELDFWYRNTSVEVGRKLEEINQILIRKGSPLLARSWWGAILSMGLRGFLVGLQRLWLRSKAVGATYGLQIAWSILGATSITAVLKLGPAGAWADVVTWVSHHGWLAAVIIVLLLLLVAATVALPAWLYSKLRTTLEDLIAIDAGISSIYECFLRINPYLNYAFELEACYFIVLDTGPDCLTAQSFWDEGGKKVSRITVRDNILGGSPDTMGFYPANEYYPYSQIAWLEKVLNCIGVPKAEDLAKSHRHRIFVGLHAPPANLSVSQRRQAEQQLALSKPYVVMKQGAGGYNIRYGTVNHYLSQFFYLCLGYRENERDEVTGPGIDAVFAGHAHWNMEFQLRKPAGAVSAWSPELLYGKFSAQVEAAGDDPNAQWRPLLLQTAAGGPQGPVGTEVPPNFRYVTVNGKGAVCNLRPCNLISPPRFVTAGAAEVADAVQSASATRQP